jgi:hypothetical protein
MTMMHAVSLSAFVKEMAARMHSLGLIASTGITLATPSAVRPVVPPTAVDNAAVRARILVAIIAAERIVREQEAALTRAIDQKLNHAEEFAKLADYLEGKRADLQQHELPEDSRQAAAVLKFSCATDNSLPGLCRQLRQTHREALTIVTGQRVFLARAVSTAKIKIADAKAKAGIALTARGARDATTMAIAAVKERAQLTEVHKARFNGRALLSQLREAERRERERRGVGS